MTFYSFIPLSNIVYYLGFSKKVNFESRIQVQVVDLGSTESSGRKAG